MSLSLDLAERELKMTTFTGGWIREAHRCERAVEGTLVNESRTGFSSSRANPGFILSEREARNTAASGASTWSTVAAT